MCVLRYEKSLCYTYSVIWLLGWCPEAGLALEKQQSSVHVKERERERREKEKGSQ